MSIKSWLVGAAAISAAVLSAALPEDIIRIEAESFTPDSTRQWAVKDHFPKWYRSRPSGGKFLAAPFAKTGTAATTVTLKKAGKYRMHMRRLDPRHYRAPFFITVTQNGKELITKEFDKTALRSDKAMEKKFGWQGVTFVWESLDFEAEAGDITITVKPGETKRSLAVGSRHLDTFWLTQDLNYEPNMSDTVKLFVRIRVKEMKVPGVIHYFLHRADHPHYEHGNFGKSGLGVGVFTKGGKKDFYSGGFDTGWISFSERLLYIDYDKIYFRAMYDYYKKDFPGAVYEVSFSTTPDDSGIIKSFTTKAGSHELFVQVNLTTMDIKEFEPPKPKKPAKK